MFFLLSYVYYILVNRYTILITHVRNTNMKNKYWLPKKKFNYIRGHFPVLSTQLVINFGHKKSPVVLLVKRKEEPAKGQWWVLGGVILKTEPSEKAALRVALRETGVKCKIIKQLPNTREIFHGMKTIPYDGIMDYLSENYLMEPVGSKKIKLDDTSSDYRFVTSISKEMHPYLQAHLRNSGLFKH